MTRGGNERGNRRGEVGGWNLGRGIGKVYRCVLVRELRENRVSVHVCVPV